MEREDDPVVFRQGDYRFEDERGVCEIHVPHDVHASRIMPALEKIAEGGADGNGGSEHGAA